MTNRQLLAQVKNELVKASLASPEQIANEADEVRKIFISTAMLLQLVLESDSLDS